MTIIYNIYIFDRHCECIFYTEWACQNSPLAARPGQPTDSGTVQATVRGASSDTQDRNSLDQHRPTVWPSSANSTHGSAQRNLPMEEEAKLVYGVAFSTRNIVNKLSGKDGPQGGNPGGFMSFATNTYRMHYYESSTGVKFILNTDPHTASMQQVLEMIYRNIYVEYVTKNPLFNPNPATSAPIENDYFRAVLNNYI
ncbi:TRAPP complex subunit bet5, partial [Linderina pennispora]